MAASFLPKRRKSLYHRITIPQALRPFFGGKAEVWRSLRTRDKDEARCRASTWESRGRRLFLTLQKRGEAMTNEEREALVAHWLEASLDEAEDARALAGAVSDERRGGMYLALSDQFDEAHEALLTNNWRKVEREADELLRTAGLPALDHDGADFGRLCRRLLLAKQEYLRVEADRWDGQYNHVPRPTPQASRESQAKPKETTPTGPPFSVVVEKYLAENPRAARTAKPLKAELLKFVEVIGGDRPASAITKTDGRTYKDHLLNVRKLKLQTCVKHLSNLTVVFKWAEKQGYIPENTNPVRGLAPDKKAARKQAQDRRAFTDEELLKVFTSKDFKSQREEHPERYWLTLLCLFQVCRREEAGQLSLADIQEAEGIPFIRITDEGEGQSLKNEGSKRRLPIHSSLVALGFMEYVERIRQSGHTRLFPQLKKSANGFSDAVGKWFSRVVTKVGLTDPALVLHSFRHGGITKLHSAGVPHNTVEILAGHAAQNVHGQTYVHRERLPLSLLRDGLEKLDYSGVVKALT